METGTRKAAICGALFLALSCDRAASRADAEAAPPGEAGAGPARGERVVVEAEAAEFFEARVLDASADRVRVQLSNGDSRSVALSDVYRIAAAGDVRVGQLRICRVAPSDWVACRVTAKLDSEAEVVVPGRPAQRIEASALVVPSPVTELNIQRRFERARDREEFERELGRAGAPRAPSGWKPGPSEAVLVRIESAWFSGKVVELGRQELGVELSGSARVTPLPRQDVIPAPPHSPAPRRGEYALARPVASGAAWVPVRVESVSDSELSVRDVAGARRTLTVAEVVPLGR